MNRVLIVDDEAGSRQGLSELVGSWGFSTDVAADGAEGLSKAKQFRPQVIIADLVMPRMDGLGMLSGLEDDLDQLAVVMLTAKGSIATAVEAMKKGAFDYLTKPVDTQQLRQVLDRAVARSSSFALAEKYRKNLRETGAFGRMVGSSPAMMKLHDLMSKIGPSAASVLIVGESGTGKELVARTLHELSPRAKARFVGVNCAAIPETLLESELFGHMRGAFTGATTSKKGKFALADGGTIFLDEIGTMSQALQAKLLRVVQEREFEPLGSERTQKVDVRVIAASNRDLRQMVAEGKFQEDLYYRLNVIPIHIPPLRERREDIPLLVEHFVAKHASRAGKRIEGLGPGVLEQLQSAEWAGNVRELENTVERAVVLSPSPIIHSDVIRILGASSSAGSGLPSTNLRQNLDWAERETVRRALDAAGGVKKDAAEAMGISQRALSYYLAKHRVE
jgi:DNA-binding NtrC family response regulator